MISTVADRRVRKTKMQLLNALTNLMQEKSINEITVREVADVADINRGTFYLHYKDVYDMVEQLERELFEQVCEVFSKHPVEELSISPLPMLIDVYQFHANNAPLFKVLFGKNGSEAFTSRMDGMVKERALTMCMEKNKDDKNFEYFYSFISSGFLNLISNWLETGMKESPEQMAILTEKMISTGYEAIHVDA